MLIRAVPAAMPIAPDTLLQGLEWRYATKAFDPSRTIAPSTWEALEASLVLTPWPPSCPPPSP